MKELRLRPYKACDAKYIASWIKDEKALREWSSDRYSSFPVTGGDINKKYFEHNGDCSEEDNFYPLTAICDTEVAGHLILRYTDKEKKVLRFGFVIIDDTKRGQGIGKQMLALAIKYAFEILKANKVTLGVFENNTSAYHCYKNLGFTETDECEVFEVMGEKWKILEMECTRK